MFSKFSFGVEEFSYSIHFIVPTQSGQQEDHNNNTAPSYIKDMLKIKKVVQVYIRVYILMNILHY